DPVLISDVPITPLDIKAAFAGSNIVVTAGTEAGHRYELALYRINGQQLYRTYFDGGGRTVFNTGQELSPGMYILRVMDKEQHGTAGITKLVKQ
ncbi:MAG: T9SS type A sorting domain-containing protein, partial [Taibaiella sp.]|nr:T9SS type A sorting domain-containing protein [Taibaiella sp.]